MTKLSLLATTAFLVFSANTAFATSACPIINGGNAGSGGGVSSAYTAASGVTNGGCNVLITFNSNGSITTSFPNTATSYDNGGDDVLVGIVNNTGSAINSVTLTGTTSGNLAAFAFENDGACDPTWTFVGGGNPCGTTTSGYGHQGVTFSNILAGNQTGTINFAGGIAAGGSNWFSLEGPVDLNLQVNPVPEPSSVVLFGTVLGIGALWSRRRRMNS